MLRHNKVDLALHHLRDATDAGRPSAAAPPRSRRGDTAPPRRTWADVVARRRSPDSTSRATASRPSLAAAATPPNCCSATPMPRWPHWSTTSPDGDRSPCVGRGLGAYIALQLAGARAASGARSDPARRSRPRRRPDRADVAELLLVLETSDIDPGSVCARRAGSRPASARLRPLVRAVGARRIRPRRTDRRVRPCSDPSGSKRSPASTVCSTCRSPRRSTRTPDPTRLTVRRDIDGATSDVLG